MRKLLIICAGLTVCSLALWGLSRAQAGGYADPPSPMQAEVGIEPAYAATVEKPEILPPAAPDSQPDGLPLGGWPDEAEQSPAEEEEPGPPPLLALTFDDGPSKDYTPLLLDGLRERGVHVTFFMVGVRAEKAPEIVLQAYQDGHVLASHGYDHTARLTKLSASELSVQLQKTDDIIAGITGDAPPFLLRPPYGAISETVAKKTAKANILWNIDPRDWDVRDAEKVYNHIMEHAVDGGVVILHDIYATTVEGALMAIDGLLAQGWKLVTVPELYEAYGIPLVAGGIYRGPEAYILPEEG